MPRQKRNLARPLSKADDMVQKKVVELIWPNNTLGALDAAILGRRHKLWRNFSVQDRIQNTVCCCIKLIRLSGPTDQILDQGFGHAGIDGIMAHLIADAVCAPAQRQLRQIPCANNKAGMMPRKAEQIIRAQARLHVFKGHIMDGLTVCKRVLHICQHAGRSGTNVDFLGVNTGCLHQLPCIAFGVIRRAEPRHSIAANKAARQAEAVAGFRRNDQRMGAVQPSRNTDNHRFGMGGL